MPSPSAAARADADGSDDEDEGRAAVFKGQQRQPRQGVKAPSLAMHAGPARETSGKPKKKRRKKTKEPEGS